MKSVILFLVTLLIFISCAQKGEDIYVKIKEQIQSENFELSWRCLDSLKVMNPQFITHDTTLSVLEKDLIERTFQHASNIVSYLPTSRFESMESAEQRISTDSSKIQKIIALIPKNDALKDSITRLMSKWQAAALSVRNATEKITAGTENKEALQKEIQSNLIGVWIDKGPITNNRTTMRFGKDFSFIRTFQVNLGIDAKGKRNSYFEYRWSETKTLGTYTINGRKIILAITSEFKDGVESEPYNDGNYFSLWKINGKWALFFLREKQDDDSAAVSLDLKQNQYLIKK